MIYILTGAIRTGKTTALIDWTITRNDVDGLLSPDDKYGKRYFLEIKSSKTFEFEVEYRNEDVIQIGVFCFLKAAFKKANDYLTAIASEDKVSYLLIDELGKLELKNEGLHRSAKTLIPEYEFNKSKHLILVVRDYLLADILIKYDISQYLILKNDDLKALA